MNDPLRKTLIPTWLQLAMDQTQAHYLAYILAHRRSAVFYLNVAPNLTGIYAEYTRIFRERARDGEKNLHEMAVLVWLEGHPTEASARERIMAIRRWTHAWQRRLIETVNPDWVELYNAIQGAPPILWSTIPE